MKRNVINIAIEPRGDTYRQLVDWACEECAEFFLIARSTGVLSHRALQAQQILVPFLLWQREVTEWPGTVLFYGEKATEHRFVLNGASGQHLKQLASSLYEWRHPELLEDLGFLRADGGVWMASIAHERDAYFELTEEERVSVLNRIPGLTLTSHVPEPGATPC